MIPLLTLSLIAWAGPLASTLRCSTPCYRAHVGCGGIFPDEGPPSADTDSNRRTIDDQQMVGFWNVYDDQAMDDALSRVSYGANIGSVFSSRMVLRADGRTSRGSDFPGGTWRILQDKDTTRKRIELVLINKVERQEWRYHGLIFWLQLEAG